MFYLQKQKLNKAWFNWKVRQIFQTPKIQCDPDSKVLILSQLYHADLSMYMVAAKSFAQFVKPKRFIIIDDGLEEQDRALLKEHFERIDFIPSGKVDVGQCPRGGCWERLLSIAHFNNKDYVIQLDSDTVTLRSPTEVLSCILEQRSFTLGTTGGNTTRSLEETSRIASGWKGVHVQVLAEQALRHLPPELGRSYVHGCAGFAGFAPGVLTSQAIERFSLAMENLIGRQKWNEWGSEQVASNFMVANTSSNTILQSRDYPFWQRGINIGQAKLIHFFGTHRYETGQYVKSSMDVIRTLT